MRYVIEEFEEVEDVEQADDIVEIENVKASSKKQSTMKLEQLIRKIPDEKSDDSDEIDFSSLFFDFLVFCF